MQNEIIKIIKRCKLCGKEFETIDIQLQLCSDICKDLYSEDKTIKNIANLYIYRFERCYKIKKQLIRKNLIDKIKRKIKKWEQKISILER